MLPSGINIQLTILKNILNLALEELSYIRDLFNYKDLSEGCSEFGKEPVLKTGALMGMWVRVPPPPPSPAVAGFGGRSPLKKIAKAGIARSSGQRRIQSVKIAKARV